MSGRTASPIRRSPLEGVAPRAGTDPALTELAPLDKFVARGIGGPELAGRVVEAGRVTTWHLRADEAIVVFPPDASAEAARVLAGARSRVDLSSGYTVLRVASEGARALLAQACPVDLSEGAVPDRAIVQGALANVRVVLARTDTDGTPAFTLLVARDEARYLWDALTALAGLSPGGHP